MIASLIPNQALSNSCNRQLDDGVDDGVHDEEMERVADREENERATFFFLGSLCQGMKKKTMKGLGRKTRLMCSMRD